MPSCENGLEDLHALKIQDDPPKFFRTLGWRCALEVGSATRCEKIDGGLESGGATLRHDRAETLLWRGKAQNLAAVEVAKPLHLFRRGRADIDLLGQVDSRPDFIAMRTLQCFARRTKQRLELRVVGTAECLGERRQNRKLVDGFLRALGKLAKQTVHRRKLSTTLCLPQQSQKLLGKLVAWQIGQDGFPA